MIGIIVFVSLLAIIMAGGVVYWRRQAEYYRDKFFELDETQLRSVYQYSQLKQNFSRLEVNHHVLKSDYASLIKYHKAKTGEKYIPTKTLKYVEPAPVAVDTTLLDWIGTK